MSEQMLIAIMNMVASVGFAATSTFLKNKGATIDSAIIALDLAAAESLADYKAADLAARTPPTP